MNPLRHFPRGEFSRPSNDHVGDKVDDDDYRFGCEMGV